MVKTVVMERCKISGGGWVMKVSSGYVSGDAGGE